MRNVLLLLSLGFLWLASGCSRPQYAHFRPVASPPVVVRASEVAAPAPADKSAPSDMLTAQTASAAASAEPTLLPPTGLALAGMALTTAAPTEAIPELSRKEMRKLLRAHHQEMKATGPTQQGDLRKVHGLAIASFISAIVGIFIAGIILGILAVVFGAIALGRIKAEPDRFRGQGLAIAGIVLGAIVTILTIIVVAAAA